MTHIYIISLEYPNHFDSSHDSALTSNVTSALEDLRGQSKLTALVGYFGICLQGTADIWVCDTNTFALAAQLGQSNDPLGMIAMSNTFRTDVVFSGLLYVLAVSNFSGLNH